MEKKKKISFVQYLCCTLMQLTYAEHFGTLCHDHAICVMANNALLIVFGFAELRHWNKAMLDPPAPLLPTSEGASGVENILSCSCS